MNGRKGLAEYADENLALFDGEDEVNQAEEVKQEDEQPHFEEERKLLDILQEMEKEARLPEEDTITAPTKIQSRQSLSPPTTVIPPSLVKPERPRDMPALAVVEGVTPLARRSPPASVRWHQDRTRRLVLKIDLELNFDLDRRSCYVQVDREGKRVDFQYLEMACEKGLGADRVLYYLHELPFLHLFSTVDANTTEVKFNPRY